MKEHIEGMIIERYKLKDKVDKLKTFIDTQRYYKCADNIIGKNIIIDENQTILLETQLYYMEKYLDVLEKRIEYDKNK